MFISPRYPAQLPRQHFSENWVQKPKARQKECIFFISTHVWRTDGPTVGGRTDGRKHPLARTHVKIYLYSRLYLLNWNLLRSCTLRLELLWLFHLFLLPDNKLQQKDSRFCVFFQESRTMDSLFQGTSCGNLVKTKREWIGVSRSLYHWLQMDGTILVTDENF